MLPLVDGLRVLQQDGASVLFVLACVLWGGVLMLDRVAPSAAGRRDIAAGLALAAGLWILPALAGSLVILSVSAMGVSQSTLWLMGSLGLLGAVWLAWRQASVHFLAPAGSWTAAIALGLILILSMVLRLAFLRDITLPSYFDSAAHYTVMRQLLGMAASPSSSAALALPMGGYYHLGYHLLLASWSRLSQLALAQLMLVSGQIFIALIPIPLFFMAYRSTGSRLAGLLAVVVCAFGWYMPAHAANWGKYPALLALLPLLGACNLGLLASGAGLASERGRVLLLLFVSAAITASVIHTRMIFVVIACVGAWHLAGLWSALKPAYAASALLAVGISAVALGVGLRSDPILVQVLHPYLGSGIGITIAVVLLMPFALRRSPRLGFAALLTIVFLLAALFLPAPVPALPTVLDRPLVEMLLALPLSLLGALGFAGMAALAPPHRSWLPRAAALLLSIAIGAHALASYTLYPSPCCTVVSSDDLVALDWLNRNSADDVSIAIATSPVRFAPEVYPPMEPPSDAGAWTQGLTGRSVLLLPYTTDFSAATSRALICRHNVSFVYVGDTARSFDLASLQASQAWYRSRLLLPSAAIYEVTDCAS